MIKKLLGSLAIAFISIGSVFADESAWNIFTVGNDFTQYPQNTVYTFKALSSSSFITYGMAQAKAIALINYRCDNGNKNLLIYWNKQHKLSYVGDMCGYALNTDHTYYGLVKGTYTTAGIYSINNWHSLSNGSTISLDGYYTNDNLDGKMTRFAIKKVSGYSDGGAFCMIYDSLNSAICIQNITPNWLLHNGEKITEQGLTNDPINFDASIVGTSPRTTNGTTTTGGNTVANNNGNYCPTVAELMAKYPINYDTGACYSNVFSFSGGTITNTKKTIFETFSNKGELNEYIQLYSLYCKAPNTTEQCQQAFTGNADKYSIVDYMNNNGLYPDQLWQYCNLGLNYSPNTTTCVGSGVLNTGTPTNAQIIEALTNGEYNLQVPSTDSVINEVCPADDPNCMNNATRDVFGSLSSIYNKITTLFKTRSGVSGIIPDYILWIAFLIILFTILFKK